MDDLPSEDVQAAIEVERRIKKRYLGESETNLRPAVHEALRRLYSLPRLPANPYFFVATALSAHSSHGSKRSVWTVGDDEVMDELEDVTLVEGGNGQTCKLSRFSDAWGLPHVLRACDREGLTDVKTLLRRFPQTLYPTAVRQTDPRNPQVNRQALLSLQEGCLHRRQYQGAPTRIGLRVDVLVDAPTIAEGLQTFVDFIVDAIEGVAAASEGHAIRGVLLLPGKANWGSEAKSQQRAQWWSLDKIRREQRGFDVAVKRATSSHHKVAMECTVRCAVPPALLDGAYGTAASVMADRGGGALVTHFSVRTYYTFHYRAKTRKGVAPTASHYATLPFESMFTGLFLEEQAATAYNEMYGSAVAPTSPMVLKNNAERMMNVGIKAMRRDDMPRALRVATLVLLLRGDLGWHDGDDPPPAGSKDEQRERAFADLIRMTNSEAVWLFNVSQEARALEGLFIGPHALSKTAQNAEALAKHLQHFHFRVDDFMKDAVRRDFGLEPLRLMMSEVLVGAIRACERGGRALANPQTERRVSLAVERALEKARLLCTVVSLTRTQEVLLMRPSMALMQAGAFGLNLIVESENHGQDADALVDAAIAAAIEKKKRRRRRKAKAVAAKEEGNKTRRRSWFGGGGGGSSSDSDDEGKPQASSFASMFTAKQEKKEEEGGLTKLAGIPLVDPRAPEPTAKELDRVWQRVYEVVASGTCVYFEAGRRWMRRHRYVPPKYYDASMLLQYAVDSRLDETLQNILTEVMQPPLIRNPFPEVVGRLRGTGHQFDVNFHLGGGDIITGGAAGGGTKAGTKRFTADGKPLKGLIAAKPRVTLVPDEDQPTAIYAARPPASRDSDAACYGLYSAVALCDPVRCSRLFEELPQLFTSRQWQEGPYMYQCIPALGGDASFSAGLGPALEHANKRRSKRDAGKRTHTVGFTPVVEERTKVSGPDKARAADIYGTDVVRRLIQMQTDTPWLVHDIMVPRGVLAAAGAAAARRQLEAEQRLAEEGKMPAHLDDRPGTAAASDLLSRMGSVASTPAGVDRNGMGPVPPAARRPDPERLEELKRQLAEAEAALGGDVALSSGVGSALGQNAMREQDIIRVPWEEIRGNQRDVARIVSRVAQQGGEACAHLSVKYKGKYLPAYVNFHFLFEQRGGGGLNDDVKPGKDSREEGEMRSKDENHDTWPLDAYIMVFGSRSDALAYAKWHSWKGDPSSSKLARAAAEAFETEEANVARDMDYLAAIRCRTARALVLQEGTGRVANLASTLMGIPMLTQGLQDSNGMLQHLIDLADAPEDLLIKLDTRSARDALLEYLDDTERLLTSPSLSYYLGANRVMVKNLAEIRAEDARRGGALREETMELVRELNTWLAVSEMCITRALYRIIKEQDERLELRRAWRRAKREEREREEERRRLAIEREVERQAGKFNPVD